MKKLLWGSLLSLLALCSLTFTACDKEDDPKNIAELAQDTENLSTLVAALDRAGLTSTFTGTENYTVFAPTNAAFSKFLSDNGFANLEAVPVATLKQVLLYHVVNAKVESKDLTDGSYAETLAKATADTDHGLNLFIRTTGGVKINGASVTTADVQASNGVVHIVDQVIFPLPTVVNHALLNPNFTTLVAALTRPDLGVDYVGLLSGTGKFTVFAPTNAAFAALLAELGASSLNDIPAGTLNAVLQYHVVSGANVRAADITEGLEPTTYQGGKFKISLVGGAKITDGAGRVSNIVVTDVQGDNGVIHAIDKVLLPQ